MENSLTQVIAYVRSSTDATRRYTIIRRAGSEQDDWDCDCKARYFDKSQPCKHVQKVRTLKRVKPGMMTLVSVQLTDAGQHILADWRKRNGMPLIAPTPDMEGGRVAAHLASTDEDPPEEPTQA